MCWEGEDSNMGQSASIQAPLPISDTLSSRIKSLFMQLGSASRA